MGEYGIKLTPLGTGWKATWFGECETDEVGIDENPIEALKILLETKKVRDQQEIINTTLKSQVEDILADHARTHRHSKAIIDILEVSVTRDHLAGTPKVSIGVIILNKFLVPGRMITDHNFIKTQTDATLYRLFRYFNEIFAACIKNSTTLACIGPFSVATNILIPEGILYVHPRTYHDLLHLVRDTRIEVSLICRD